MFERNLDHGGSDLVIAPCILCDNVDYSLKQYCEQENEDLINKTFYFCDLYLWGSNLDVEHPLLWWSFCAKLFKKKTSVV